MEKVSIVGSGNVGANTAFFIAEKGITNVCLYDIQEGLSTGKALDMMEAAPIRQYRNRITPVNNIKDINNSESVIIAAGTACRIGTESQDLLKENLNTVIRIIEEVISVTPESIIILATEPVDILCTLIAQRFKIPRNRLIGLGGILDSARLKSAIARELSISAENVTAMVIGRHTGGMIVLPEYTRVSGIPAAELLSLGIMAKLKEETAGAGSVMAELSECPGTYYTPSAAAAMVIDSIHMDLKRILSVSVILEGEYGISGIALSLPCIIGKNGIENVLTPPLTSEEHKVLKKSAEDIKKFI